MLYLPKEKLDINTQIKLNPKTYTFKQFASQQLDKKQHHYFAADFECTTKEPYTVYMVTIEDITTGQQWFYKTIDEFLMFCEDYPNSTFYFHNGTSYDNEFIINKVLKDNNDWHLSNVNGTLTIYKFLNEVEVTPKGNKIKIEKGMPKQLKAKIRLKDTMDIVMGSIAGIGESIGVKKGLGYIETPLVAYINEDNTWFEQDRDNEKILYKHNTDYKRDFINRKWWIYAMQDTHILAEIIRYYSIVEHSENKQNTAASIAYNEMLDGYNQYKEHVLNLKKQISISKKEDGVFADKIKYYNRFAKEAYKGGIAWVNNGLSKILIEGVHGYHLDYNSMYPSIYMQSDKYPLPMNIPTNEVTNLFIIKFKKLNARCKQGHFPLLKNRTHDINGNPIKGLNARKYVSKVTDSDITLTSPEYKYLKEHYTDITYESYEVQFYKRHTLLEAALRKHGEKWYALKEKHGREKNEAAKLYDKMMLNSVYGYLGYFYKLVKTYYYELDKETGQTHKILNEDGERTSKYAELGMDHAEVPAAAFITAYGRIKLAEDINKIGVENVVATDTDSLFVINKTLDELNQLVEIDPYKLGALDKEHEFGKIRAIKPKTWCISDDLEQARKYPDDYAKADPYQPIAQATAGSNYKFKDIRNFKPGEKFLSKETVRGKGGVGIKSKWKILGERTDNEALQELEFIRK